MQKPNRHRSLFWPILLIGVGIVWLLVNFNVIAAVNFNSLLRLWPLILIVIGLDLLFGRHKPWSGALIGILTVGVVVVFLVFGPALGWTTANTGNAKVETFTTPLDKTTHANFVFYLSSQHVDLHALTNSTDLIHAEIGHTGIIDYTVSGTDTKTVQLSQRSDGSGWISFDFSMLNLKWDLGITSEIPVNLTMDGGSGSVNADLTGVKLQSLQASMGSGSSEFTLPASNSPYQAHIKSGSGSVNITLPSRTNLTLETDSGSGSLNINLPANAAVRIEVSDTGSGSLNIPSDLIHAGGSFAAQGTGTWQTSNYDTAAYKILIKVANRGSGSVNIH